MKKVFSARVSLLLIFSAFSFGVANAADCSTFNLTAQVTNITCKGAENGSINITVTGGTTPYSFYWQGPNAFTATTEDISGLKPGSYSVIASDSAGCSIFFSTFVSEPNALLLNAQVTNVTCNGANNGAINLFVSGGTSPYSYLWSNAATTEDLSNLSPGSYKVVVTDSLGCKDSLTSTITEPAILSLSTTQTNATCADVDNASIDLILSGGTGPYTYAWSNGKTTEDISAIGAGTYTVTVTDLKGCTATTSATITEPAAMVLTTSFTPASCNASDGTASVTVAGGATPYSYLWSPGGQTNATATNLSAGNYTISVTDANSCVTSAGVVVPTNSGITVSSTVTDVKCKGGNEGAIDLTVTGGSTPYTFSWTPGSATTEDISALTAQTYNVVVTDAANCTVFYIATVNEPSQGLSATGITQAPKCFNDSTGSISLSVNGGTSPYTFMWSNGETTQNITGIDSGAYTVDLTDANNCTSSVAFNVANPTAVQVTGTATNVTCNGSNDGSININATGGTTPYSYFWSGGQTTKNISGLSAGNHSVTITDSLGCIKDTAFIITEPAPLVIGADSIINVKCHGGSNGVIDVKPTGGTPSYSYLWANGDTKEKITNLTAGSYKVTVTDFRGCEDSVTFVVSQPDSIQLTITSDSANCNQANATATVSVIGGIGPYTYSWSTSPTQTNATATGLGLGGYTVNVFDNNNCGKSANVGIKEKGAPTISLTPTNPKCYAENSGNIVVTVNGGTPPYSFLWSTGATTQNLQELEGSYQVTVTDNATCSAQDSATITAPADIISTIASTGTTCQGGNNGAANLTVSGGVAPYTFLWNNGATTEDLTGIAANTYTVTIRDLNNCKDSATTIVTQGGAITMSKDVTGNESCPGSKDGYAIMKVLGGTAPFTFIYNGTEYDDTITALGKGLHEITVRDANGCEAKSSVTINQTSQCNDLTRPNSFTPNRDGDNDTWVLRNIEMQYPENSIEVYNRWGSLIFSAKGYNNRDVVWDGTFNGENAPDATYYYILYPAPGLEPITGTVTIVR